MKISSPSDLFTLYSFDDDCKIEVHQLCNALGNSCLYEINAICLKAAKIKDAGIKLNATNTFLLKNGRFCIVYKGIAPNIEFLSIKLNKA